MPAETDADDAQQCREFRNLFCRAIECVKCYQVVFFQEEGGKRGERVAGVQTLVLCSANGDAHAQGIPSDADLFNRAIKSSVGRQSAVEGKSGDLGCGRGIEKEKGEGFQGRSITSTNERIVATECTSVYSRYH